MLGVLFAIAVLAVLVAHYVLVARPRQRAGAAGVTRAPPLWKAMGHQPLDVFVQPTCTWTRLLADGQIQIGVHPMIAGLVGANCRSELLAEGADLAEGDFLARVGCDGRWLTVRSPISGTITASNPGVESDPTWAGAESRGTGWLYRMKTEGLAETVAGWLIAEQAVEWTKNAYRDVRDHLARVGANREVGFLMADGGELPAGILDDLDPSDWASFQEAFLD